MTADATAPTSTSRSDDLRRATPEERRATAIGVVLVAPDLETDLSPLGPIPTLALIAGAAPPRPDEADAAAVAVGAIVFLPVLLFLAAGDDKSGELSRLKGEFDAVTVVAKDKDCISAEQLQAEEEQRIAAEEALKKQQEERSKGLRSGT